MKALSVKQPWAWAIVNGFKPIENRTRDVSYRGEVLIHTGKADAGKASWHALRERMVAAGDDPAELPDLEDLAKGGIVGRATIIEVMRGSSSPWFEGPYGLVLAKATPLKLIPWPGQLGLFEVPDHVVERSLTTHAAGQAQLFGATS